MCFNILSLTSFKQGFIYCTSLSHNGIYFSNSTNLWMHKHNGPTAPSRTDCIMLVTSHACLLMSNFYTIIWIYKHGSISSSNFSSDGIMVSKKELKYNRHHHPIGTITNSSNLRVHGGEGVVLRTWNPPTSSYDTSNSP